MGLETDRWEKMKSVPEGCRDSDRKGSPIQVHSLYICTDAPSINGLATSGFYVSPNQ